MSAYNQAISNFIGNEYFDEWGEEDSLFGIGKKAKAKKAEKLIRKAEKKLEKVAKAKGNKKSAMKAKAQNTLSALAARDQRPLHDVALDVVDNQRENVEKYVIAKGEQPLQNSAELATQAYMLRDGDIKQLSQELEIPYEDAEFVLEDAEAQLEEDNNPESENFLGSVVAALKPIAQKGIAKIKERKRAKGKKAALWSTLDKRVNPTGENAGKASDIEEALNRIKEEEKKKEINKMLPFIIGGVLVFGFIVFFIARSTKK